MANPRILVLTAPSGAGKSTIARRVLRIMPNVRFSVSATTRPARSAEVDGVHYHFLSPAAFADAIAAGRFVEHEEVYPGLLYGTLVSEVDAATPSAPVLLDIDVRGARRVKEIFGEDALVIFVAPPSFDELRKRLAVRGTESADALATRLKRAELEMTFSDAFDARVVNDEIERATDQAVLLISEFLASATTPGQSA